MVVLSAAILSKSKPLVARQFCEMTRIRVEGLLSAFTKLVEGNKDHTYVETETVRYVYQPIEQLFVVLITNKSSNILEDLETLRLVSKVAQDVCQTTLSEELVMSKAFDLIFAFDECVTFGYRESVTVGQIKTYMEMDSHEERLHQMIEQSKINEAKEIAKKKQKELLQQRVKEKIESVRHGEKADPAESTIESLEEQLRSLRGESAPTGGNMGSRWPEEAPAAVAAMPKKGLALGKKPPAAREVMAETFGKPNAAAPVADPEPQRAVPFNPLAEPVTTTIEETVKATLMSEGGLKGEIEVVGQYVVTVLDEAKANLVAFNTNAVDPKFKMKMHPNLNKAAHAERRLEIRDPARGYRANVPAPLLKWRFATGDEGTLPLSISCWPSATADGTCLVVEYELTNDAAVLNDVVFSVPAPSSASPEVISNTGGECNYDHHTECICWRLPQVDSSESSGTLELQAKCDEGSCFPLTMTAAQDQTVCGLEILEAYHMTSKEPIKYLMNRSCTFSLTIER